MLVLCMILVADAALTAVLLGMLASLLGGAPIRKA